MLTADTKMCWRVNGKFEFLKQSDANGQSEVIPDATAKTQTAERKGAFGTGVEKAAAATFVYPLSCCSLMLSVGFSCFDRSCSL